ncbi:MAG: hypoxanthine phosphoribosyltransferase [Thermodesulfobacteria bacterium]|nr:hypoxanthine phosphoribosyltransferase [Thermodesulfobacteriota bacterium]
MAELRLVVSPEEIAARVKEIGARITKDYTGKEVVFIGILKGAFVFLADLIRAVEIPDLEIDFVRLASYGRSDTSSGEIQITKDIELTIKGKDVIVVEDIVDTGYTLEYFQEVLKLHEPRSVKICCLVDKGERRKAKIKIDYCGFEIPKGFLVGYGLDFAEKYRHLPGIYEIVREK